jgi:uncharacterized membrane protein
MSAAFQQEVLEEGVTGEGVMDKGEVVPGLSGGWVAEQDGIADVI